MGPEEIRRHLPTRLAIHTGGVEEGMDGHRGRESDARAVLKIAHCDGYAVSCGL